MTKLEQLKECAAKGMTASEAARFVGCHMQYAYNLKAKGVVDFAKGKAGRKVGSPWKLEQRQPDADLSAIEQMLADIAALPVAKRNDYRTLRVGHGVPHHVAVAVLA